MTASVKSSVKYVMCSGRVVACLSVASANNCCCYVVTFVTVSRVQIVKNCNTTLKVLDGISKRKISIC